MMLFVVDLINKYISDFTLRQIVQSSPDGVYYTMISDSCHSGGLLESTREAFDNSYQLGNNVGGFAGYPLAPSNLLDLLCDTEEIWTSS